MEYYYDRYTSDNIRSVFEGYGIDKFYDIHFECPFNVGDRVTFKTECPKNRFYPYNKQVDISKVWVINKVVIDYYSGDKMAYICNLTSEDKGECGFSDYMYDVPISEFISVDGSNTRFEFDIITPYMIGDYCWLLCNHWYDCFTPYYECVIGHRLIIENTFDKDDKAHINFCVLANRYNTKCKDFVYFDSYSIICRDNEPQLWLNDIIINKMDFNSFAVNTYQKDGFKDCFGNDSLYSIFAKLFGKTLHDLKFAKIDNKNCEKKVIKKKKKNNKNNNKLEEIISSLSEAEIKKLKKLLV